MIRKLIPLLLVLIVASGAAQAPVALGDREKSAIVEDLCRLLKENYVFADTAAKFAARLKGQLKAGAYKTVSDPSEFSDLVNKDLNAVYKDGHLQTQYNPAFAEQLLHPATGPAQADPLTQLQQENFGLRKLEILHGNIGYMDLSAFLAHELYGKETVKAALKFLSNTNAIIIDLRRCRGGSPRTVNIICGYFLRERTHLNDTYNRSENTTTEYWTVPDTSLKMLWTMPLYVLAGDKTLSASEEFCYDLQVLKRATIVGEKTGGAAHNTFERPVKHGFVVYMPYGRAVNPVTHTNWEKTGITPDIPAPGAKALEAAEMDIFKTLVAAAKSDREKYDLNWQYELLQAANNPVSIDSLTLKKYAGVYGQRVFTYAQGVLYYQRTGRPKFELEPMTKTVMKGKGNDYFKIEFIETAGEVNEVKVYYQDYRNEASTRDKK